MEDKNKLARLKRTKRYKAKYQDVDFDLLRKKIHQDVILTSECFGAKNRTKDYRAYFASLVLGSLIILLLIVWS